MLLDRFDLAGPLIVAPMAGGPTTPELVAATCEAGALGMLDGAYRPPGGLAEAITKIRALTRRPFGVNLFVPGAIVAPDEVRIAKARHAMFECCAPLGTFDAPLKPPYTEDFALQFDTVLQHKPAVVSFTFGVPEPARVARCHAQGIVVMGTATSLAEAQALEEVGVDAIVAQGSDAGGHRGMFDANADDPHISTLLLCEVLGGRLRVPFVAAGGMMNGRAVTAAIRAGAVAAQLGTAFLLCPEAGTSKPYREALRRSPHVPTTLTRAFSGRLARGLDNAFMRDMRACAGEVLPFPAQNALTSTMRKRSAARGHSDYLSLWAGVGYPALRSVGAGQLVQELLEQAGPY